MKTLNTNIKIAILLIFFASSCSDVLDEIPDNRTEIDNAEKIGELLTAAYPQASYTSFIEPLSDNAEDKGPDTRSMEEYNEASYLWEDFATSTRRDYSAHYWNESYEAISQANHALDAIEDLGGASTSNELSALKGEALLARAYAHFMLVNIWSKTYDPATADSDLGIPYVDEPETVVIKEYTRGTVNSVYQQIEEDLLEGLTLVTNDYQLPKYHFNVAAANAFASRFYLFKGEWDKVIEYSNKVLGTNPTENLRQWGTTYQELTFSELAIRYSDVIEPANLLVVSGNSITGRRFSSLRYQLSSDLRDQLFFNSSHPSTSGDWGYRVFGRDLTLNIPKFEEYFRTTNAAASTGFPFTTFVLLSTDEVLLNRAEAYTMLDQYDDALKDINTFLSAKTENYDPSLDELSDADVKSFYEVTDPNRYTPFYGLSSSQLPYINGILELKRREFHNEGLRWFDNRRFNMRIVHRISNGNQFIDEIILEKTDNRKQIQIPEDAIAFGLEPNPR